MTRETARATSTESTRGRRLLATLTSPTWVARVVAVLGLVSLGSALSPPVHHRLEVLWEIVPPPTHAAATAGAAAVGAILVVLSRGLRRGKSRAWWLSFFLALASVVLHLVKGLDVEESLFAALVAGLLFLARERFTAAPDPRSGRATLTTAVAAALSAYALGFAFLGLYSRDETPGSGLRARALETLLGLVGIDGPLTYRTQWAGDRTWTTLVILGAIAGVSILAMALRPAGGPHGLEPDEEAKLRGLLTADKRGDSLDYFATRRDRSVIFSPTDKAAVGYRVVGGVSLAGGNPIGDPEAWPGAIAAWREEADHYGWFPAVLGADERGATAYQRAGLTVLEIGDEAVIEVAEFSLDGRPMRAVRQAVNRIGRAGYVVTCVRARELDAAEIAEVVDRADAWRDGETERGFSMALGRLGDPLDGDCVVVRARDGEGVLRGVLYFVPWGAEGLSLDLMRRDRDGENGTVEAMIVGVVQASKELGVKRLSLNFAMFRSLLEQGERLGAGPVQRFQRDVLMQASRVWQVEALYRANEKYQPSWRPRYVCFLPGQLSDVAMAAMQAEAFITPPRWWRRSPGTPSPATPAPAARTAPTD